MSNNALITEYLIHAVAELRLLREALPDRRERIARAAMQGLMANTQWLPPDTTYPHIAEYAVRAADALISELDKTEINAAEDAGNMENPR